MLYGPTKFMPLAALFLLIASANSALVFLFPCEYNLDVCKDTKVVDTVSKGCNGTGADPDAPLNVCTQCNGRCNGAPLNHVLAREALLGAQANQAYSITLDVADNITVWKMKQAILAKLTILAEQEKTEIAKLTILAEQEKTETEKSENPFHSCKAAHLELYLNKKDAISKCTTVLTNRENNEKMSKYVDMAEYPQISFYMLPLSVKLTEYVPDQCEYGPCPPSCPKCGGGIGKFAHVPQCKDSIYVNGYTYKRSLETVEGIIKPNTQIRELKSLITKKTPAGFDEALPHLYNSEVLPTNMDQDWLRYELKGRDLISKYERHKTNKLSLNTMSYHPTRPIDAKDILVGKQIEVRPKGELKMPYVNANIVEVPSNGNGTYKVCYSGKTDEASALDIRVREYNQIPTIHMNFCSDVLLTVKSGLPGIAPCPLTLHPETTIKKVKTEAAKKLGMGDPKKVCLMLELPPNSDLDHNGERKALEEHKTILSYFNENSNIKMYLAPRQDIASSDAESADFSNAEWRKKSGDATREPIPSEEKYPFENNHRTWRRLSAVARGETSHHRRLVVMEALLEDIQRAQRQFEQQSCC